MGWVSAAAATWEEGSGQALLERPRWLLLVRNAVCCLDGLLLRLLLLATCCYYWAQTGVRDCVVLPVDCSVLRLLGLKGLVLGMLGQLLLRLQLLLRVQLRLLVCVQFGPVLRRGGGQTTALLVHNPWRLHTEAAAATHDATEPTHPRTHACLMRADPPP